MAKNSVVRYSVTCDRCSKEIEVAEHAVGGEEIGFSSEGKSFLLQIGEKEVSYNDLCENCAPTLEKLIDKAGPVKQSRKPGKRKASNGEAKPKKEKKKGKKDEKGQPTA